jgi:hypothetical protein
MNNNWVYWFLDGAPAPNGWRRQTFRLRDHRPFIGTAPPAPREILRVENDVALKAEGASLRGVAQHHQYTDGAQKAELNRVSHAEFPAGPTTMAVLIPIRKTEAWWTLPHDQRIAHFQKQGHTAIGQRFADRIYRKLYHCRYLETPHSCDFLTYFELDERHAGDFRALLAELRATPEWTYVDLEYEIWMTKE